MSPMWVSSSHFYAPDAIESSSKIMDSQSSNAIENESTYKNLSKVRTYLKRCENAINSLSGKRSTSSSSTTLEIKNEKIQQPNSSWYIDEFGTETNEDFCELNFVENELNAVDVMEKSLLEEHTNSINENDNNQIRKFEYIMPEIHVVSHIHCLKKNMRERKKNMSPKG